MSKKLLHIWMFPFPSPDRAAYALGDCPTPVGCTIEASLRSGSLSRGREHEYDAVVFNVGNRLLLDQETHSALELPAARSSRQVYVMYSPNPPRSWVSGSLEGLCFLGGGGAAST